MCFITSQSARAKIAKEDIVCYKCMYGNVSPVCPFQYYKNKITPHVPIIKQWSQWQEKWKIIHGYHSFKTRRMAEHSGFSYSTIREFVIPKGTRYYSNRTQYVSERIMMIN